MAVIVKGRGPGGKPHPKSRYNATRRQAMNDGTWAPMQPAEPVQAHIKALMDSPARLRTEDIANQAGVPYGTVKNILQGRVIKATGYVAARILAVQPTAPAARKWVDATGTRRRLQALACMQWSFEDVGNRLGVCGAAVSRWARHQQVHESTASKVRALFDEIGGTVGPTPQVRLRAQRLGWHGPFAWDDIDDPTAQPDLGDDDQQDGYDETTVGLAIDGRLTYEQLAAHRPDLIETIRRLAQRMTDVEIALHLRWPGASDGPAGKTPGQNAVNKLRSREGIPGPEKYEAVYAYRPGGRRSRNAKAA